MSVGTLEARLEALKEGGEGVGGPAVAAAGRGGEAAAATAPASVAFEWGEGGGQAVAADGGWPPRPASPPGVPVVFEEASTSAITSSTITSSSASGPRGAAPLSPERAAALAAALGRRHGSALPLAPRELAARLQARAFLASLELCAVNAASTQTLEYLGRALRRPP